MHHLQDRDDARDTRKGLNERGGRGWAGGGGGGGDERGEREGGGKEEEGGRDERQTETEAERGNRLRIASDLINFNSRKHINSV